MTDLQFTRAGTLQAEMGELRYLLERASKHDDAERTDKRILNKFPWMDLTDEDAEFVFTQLSTHLQSRLDAKRNEFEAL